MTLKRIFSWKNILVPCEQLPVILRQEVLPTASIPCLETESETQRAHPKKSQHIRRSFRSVRR